MHPGNILVREVDRSGGIAERFALLLKQLSWGLPLPGVRDVFRNVVLPPQPQLVLLDTGMIAELSSSDQRSVVTFFRVSGRGSCWCWQPWQPQQSRAAQDSCIISACM